MQGNPAPAEGEKLATRLLEVVRTLAVELAPERARQSVTLDSSLDRELGYDSLSRVELLLRIEQTLGVRLSEQAFNLAETPRDLLAAVLHPAEQGSPQVLALDTTKIALGATDRVPDHIDTLPEVLRWRAQQQPERTHVLLYETDQQTPLPISYQMLLEGAQRMAAGLQALGLEPGQSVSIMLPTARTYLESFFGVLLAGGIPVPIYPPARPSQLEDHLKRHVRILGSAATRILITVEEGRRVGHLLRRQVADLKAVVTPAELEARGAGYQPVAVSRDDVALLQYTSGSTGQPKGVILSHANLLSNIRAMGEWVGAGTDDVFVSWLPLYHDMGLIGAWLGSLYYAMLSVLMPPTAFLTRPWRWLETVHRHSATITAAPNFAYELCVNKVPDEVVAGLDLSSLRLAFNGAEPVSPRTLRRFQARFGPCGLGPEVVSPVYGLAEAAVGLSFPPLGRGPLIDRVDREVFERSGRAEPAAEGCPCLEFVACGQALGGYEIRIVDERGLELGDRATGHLEFRGPSATRGYMGNPEATARLFHGDWLDSGDLAYISGGEVYLTSRVKDVIIRAGRNLYPYELEEAVGDLPEIRKGCVAVFGSQPPGSDVEQLVVVAETRTERSDDQTLKRTIATLATDVVGVAPDDVLLVPPRSVLKTSSGKIRRAACRELYEQGRIGSGPRATWWQVLRLWVGGLLPQWRRGFHTLGGLAYAGYAYLLFGVTVAAAVVTLVVVPSGRRRWRALGGLARMLLRGVGVPLVVQGAGKLPRGTGFVLVANHSSYLDGLLLVAALTEPLSFVVKAELLEKWFPRWFLSRIDARFVERFDVEQSAEDARELSRQAAGGRPLAFFPEGTFTRRPGLAGFRMGAFVTAAENGLPVVPVTIRGSRPVLRADDWLPRRGPVAVLVGDLLTASGDGWSAALALRDEARRAILRHAGEPDLALETGPA